MIVSFDAPIFKFLYFASLVLLVGSGLYARYLEPRLASVKLFQRLHALGAAVLIASSLLDVGFTANRALGELTPYLYGAYLTRTWNGQWVILRVILIALLAWLALRPRDELKLIPKIPPMIVDRVLHVGLTLGVCLTLTMTSHAGSRGELLPIIGDFVHLIAMLVWVSAVLYTAVYRFATPRDGVNILERVSSVALLSVGALTLTGVYAGLVRLWDPALLSVTQYGQTLVLKVAVVAVAVVLAGINRFQWMPLLRRIPSRLPNFQRFLALEAVVLTGVLMTTSALTTTAPPERGAGLKRVITFEQTQGVWTLKGTANPTALGGVRLEFTITGQPGYTLEPDARVDAALDMSSHGMSAIAMTPRRSSDGTYTAEGFFGMTGDFDAVIRVPGATWRVTLPSR
jgi:putative copper export protein